MEFRRVGVCGQLPLCGYGQTGLLRNHCDCSWTLATVEENKEKKKALLVREQRTVSSMLRVGCIKEKMQSSKFHYA